jgi:hypothetical protein
MLTVERRCPGLIKIDSEGNLLWAKNYLRDRAIPSEGGVVGTIDGGYIFCATEDWTVEEGDVFGEVVKVDSGGNISWVISFVDDAAASAVQAFDGGYALVETGTLMDYEAWKEYYSAIWIIKTEKAPANPISTGPAQISDSFSTTLATVYVSVVAIIVGLVLLVYYKKYKSWRLRKGTALAPTISQG